MHPFSVSKKPKVKTCEFKPNPNVAVVGNVSGMQVLHQCVMNFQMIQSKAVNALQIILNTRVNSSADPTFAYA